MKKLIKFKSWLTLNEASVYLTTILEEAVSPADLLQLALDGYLDVSLNFLTNIPTRPAKLIHYVDEGLESYAVDVDYDQLILLNGILSLPMISDSRTLTMEKHRELLTGKSEPISQFKEIIIKHQGDLYSVCQYVMNPAFTEVKDLSRDELNKENQYSQIPESTDFVVTRTALEEFVVTHIHQNKHVVKAEGPIDDRSEKSYLNIIGGLLIIMQDKALSEQQKALFGNKSAIVKTMLENKKLEGCYGISLTNLNKKFAAANKSLSSE